MHLLTGLDPMDERRRIAEMEYNEFVRKRIADTIPNAEIRIEEIGSADHLSVTVVSEQFRGKSLVEQHKMVYAAVRDLLDEQVIHAFQLSTREPR